MLTRIGRKKTITNTLLVGMKNGTAPLENSWAFSCKTKHTISIGPNNCTPGNLFQGNKNLCSHKKLFMDVYSGFTHNRQKLETTQTSFNWGRDKQTMESYSEIEGNRYTEQHGRLWMPYAKWEKTDLEGYIPCDSIKWHSFKDKTQGQKTSQ